MAVITDVPPASLLEADDFDFWVGSLDSEVAAEEPPSELVAAHSPALAFVRLAGMMVWTLPLGLVQLVFLTLGLVPLARALAKLYWTGMARIIGLQITVRGRPHRRGATLYAANHISYLDILTLGSTVEACFVARHDVATWPGIGVIAKLGRTVFVNRERRGQAGASRDEMRSRLVEARESVILFPEGTSSDGSKVKPFRSALFAAVEDLPVTVQPVSLAYTRIDGMPIGRNFRPFVAWYGDMSLIPHAWYILGSGPVTAEIEFHTPIPVQDRKVLAARCHEVVAAGLARAIAGR